MGWKQRVCLPPLTHFRALIVAIVRILGSLLLRAESRDVDVTAFSISGRNAPGKSCCAVFENFVIQLIPL